MEGFPVLVRGFGFIEIESNFIKFTYLPGQHASVLAFKFGKKQLLFDIFIFLMYN